MLTNYESPECVHECSLSTHRMESHRTHMEYGISQEWMSNVSLECVRYWLKRRIFVTKSLDEEGLSRDTPDHGFKPRGLRRAQALFVKRFCHENSPFQPVANALQRKILNSFF